MLLVVEVKLEETEQNKNKMNLKNIQLKKKNLIFGLVAMLFVIPFVLAVTGIIQIDSFFDSSTGQPLNGVEILLFSCGDTSCNNIGSQIFNLNSGATNQITFEYPYNPSSTEGNQDYFAHYFFKEDYLPKEYVEHVWGFGATLEYDYNFNKAQSCHSPIDSFSITNSNYVNEPVVVSVEAILEADAHSAFTNLLLDFIPSGFEDYYSAETEITVEILDENDNVVNTESKTYEILADTSQNVVFTWTPSQEGNYSARVKTDVIDSQCQSSFEQFSEKQFLVWEERPQNQCYTIINDLEATPEFAKQGDLVTVRFNKISNFADDNFSKTPIQTRATYEITDSQNNVVFSDNLLLNANANDTDYQEITFTWTPNFGENFNVKVTGIGEDSLCDGKTNPLDAAILGFFVESAETYDVLFVVSDSETDVNLNEANVVFESQNGKTNSAGKVTFTSNPGSFNWIVSSTGYESKTGTADITGDVTINVALDRILIVEDDDDDDSSSGGGSSGSRTRQINFPVLSASPSGIPAQISTIDLSEGDEKPESNALVWFLIIAELIVVLGIVLFLVRKRFS